MSEEKKIRWSMTFWTTAEEKKIIKKSIESCRNTDNGRISVSDATRIFLIKCSKNK